MSENVDWGATLKRAAAINDADFQYTLRAGFLDRAVTRLAGSGSGDGIAALATKWHRRIRSDSDCAATARCLLRSLPLDTCPRAILQIIAEMPSNETDLIRVGHACASLAYDITLRDMSTAQARAERAGTPADAGMPQRVAWMAYDAEQRAQMTDCAELTAISECTQ
ncbi:MAG: hypothetical protein PHW14_03915 [Candidatus Omnitrophica bacterium]|nr:hypothetical protein [Candidatus Omnitrophota bacterium]